jgi:predicted O-linked N-acetylglucosamine transferase (SPINDLY family)
VHAAHTQYGEACRPAYPGRHSPPSLIRDPERRLRVGILSADLRNHAVGFFAESWLASHDRDRFEITCYSTATAHDAVSARLKAHVAAWREVSHLTIPDLAALIRRDRTDILLDLSGHTAGHRLPVMHLRPRARARHLFRLSQYHRRPRLRLAHRGQLD